jgi:hypothetical protein
MSISTSGFSAQWALPKLLPEENEARAAETIPWGYVIVISFHDMP